jgi:hypothetical protein
MHPAKRVRGRISVVQEERFQLVTDDGAGMLLTLSHHANVGPEQLRDYHEQGTRVNVEYQGEPNFDSGVALRVEV